MPSSNKGPVIPGGARASNPNTRWMTAAQKEAQRQAQAYEGNARALSVSGTSLSDERRMIDSAAGNRRNIGAEEQSRLANSYTGNAMSQWLDQQRQNAIQPITNGITNYLTGLRYQGNAAGAQNDLAAQPASPLAPRYGGGGSGGAGGGSGGSASPQTSLEEQLAAIQGLQGTIDPNLKALVPTTGELELMYGRLTDSLNSNKASLDADYAKGIEAVKGNYAASNNMLNQAISGDQNTLAQAAQNLGVDPGTWQNSATAQDQTEMLNRLVGVGGQNQATDLAWFEKMRNLDTSQFGDYMALANMQKQSAVDDSSRRLQELQEMANEVARNQALLALQEQLGLGSGGGSGGGGGGRGRSGGGGSSTSDIYKTLTQSATQTGDLDYAGFAQELSGLPPGLQSIALNYWIQGGGGFGAARAVQRDILSGSPTFGGDQASLEMVYQMLQGYVPGLNAIYNQTTQDKSSQSSKVYGQQPITQLPASVGSGIASKPNYGSPAKALKAISGSLKKAPSTKKKSSKINISF